MNSTATVLHGKQWEATPNEDNAARIPLPESRLPWLWRILPHQEDIVVAGREVKGGWIVPQSIGILILATILSGGAYFYHEIGWQHDQLVRLSTQKEDAEKSADREHNDRALQASADQAWREKLNNQMSDLRNDFKNLQVQSQVKGRQ